MVSLAEYAATQAGHVSPLDAWLTEKGLAMEVYAFLRANPKGVGIVYRYLKLHHGYGEKWQTEKPIGYLRNRIVEGRA